MQNIAVVGCGGVGGIMAAQLLRKGHKVTPIVNRENLRTLLYQQGLSAEDHTGERFTVSPAENADVPFDMAIMATQSTTLHQALEDIVPRLKPNAPIVTCQNGLPEDHAQTILKDLNYPTENVVGCVVGFGASMVSLGVYRQTSSGGLQLGGKKAEVAAQILADIAPTYLMNNLAGVRWSKLAINSVTATFGALSGLTLGKLLAHRFARRLALKVFAEVHEVAQALGVTVEPVGGTLAIDKIALRPQETVTSLLYKHAVLLAVGMKYRHMRSSMLYALERGRPVEIDFLNGEVVKRANALGMKTPVNTALVNQVKNLVTSGKKPHLNYLREIYEAGNNS